MSAPAELLRAMAARIERNSEDEFAGCIVVLPPVMLDGRGGEPIEILLIDPTRNARNFWATAKAEVEIAEHNFNEANSTPHLGYR
jgi:hypothetical protein